MVKQNVVGPLRDQSDWEQQDENRLGFIKNKPFYDARKIEEHKMPIQYTETPLSVGKECFKEYFGSQFVYFYKLSDIAPSYEEFRNVELEIIDAEGQTNRLKLSEEYVFFTDESDGITMYVATTDAATFATFAGIGGVYAVLDNENGESEFADVMAEMGISANLVLSRAKGELKTLDEKFIPNTVARASDINVKINELKKNGQVGYTEHRTVIINYSEDMDLTPDITLEGHDFKWISDITPTKEEFKNVRTSLLYGSDVLLGPLWTPMDVVFEATGAFCVARGDTMFVVSSVTENELGTLPKTGLYITTNTFDVGNLGEEYNINNLSGVYDFGGTIHTIDPKYLPKESVPKILDLETYKDSDGTTFGMLLYGLVLQGGGKISVSGDDTKKFWEDAVTDNVVITKFNNYTYDIYTPCIVTKNEGEKSVLHIN